MILINNYMMLMSSIHVKTLRYHKSHKQAFTFRFYFEKKWKFTDVARIVQWIPYALYLDLPTLPICLFLPVSLSLFPYIYYTMHIIDKLIVTFAEPFKSNLHSINTRHFSVDHLRTSVKAFSFKITPGYVLYVVYNIVHLPVKPITSFLAFFSWSHIKDLGSYISFSW